MASKAMEMPSAAAAAVADGRSQQASPSSLVFFIPKSVITELYTSGISVGTANTITNPLGTTERITGLSAVESHGCEMLSWLQWGPSRAAPSPLLASARKWSGGELQVATGVAVVRNEGVTALWSGLGPSLARGFFFGGARLGLYTPIKTLLCGEVARPSLEMKVLSGSLSGGLAAAVTSPIELIKIRSAILTASQCATYDEVKRGVVGATGWADGVSLHLSSSMIAGLVTTTITNPIDVIKTRMFVGGKTFAGPIACALHVFRSEGLTGFMRGWSASYARLGPHTVIMFLTAERLRKATGLQSL
ncbi:Mitochondrial substrate carrier family protein ucpB [Tetrabaena socialis]|uniref:Mitochondrial substrate carrier family protein ucpB n=1 Tax=Tetrabaena socialis TaxID=47790 RepID=A0A2J8A0W7_9CHLO|nr:Mitochondrial substrate carrier family protein ucpB [Tetrabaena socialis]|eukprot:PNH06154.1 Mitochondrial substrate carrier family protein ucpB [Tetrabaena socialis]